MWRLSAQLLTSLSLRRFLLGKALLLRPGPASADLGTGPRVTAGGWGCV